jgi:hypothetical protein
MKLKDYKNILVDVKDSEIRMNLLLSTFCEEISISEKMELIQNMITELKHARRLLQDLRGSAHS